MSAQDTIDQINNMPEEKYDAMIERFAKSMLKKEKKKRDFYESKKFNKYIGYIRKRLERNTYLECDHTYADKKDGTPVECYSTLLVRDGEKILLTPKRFNKLLSSISLYNKEFVIPDGMCSTYFVIYDDLVFETKLGQGATSYVYYIKDIENSKIKKEILKHLLNKKLKKINV